MIFLGEDMKKEEVFEILKKVKLEVDHFVVMGDASLVCQGVIDEVSVIEIALKNMANSFDMDKIIWKDKWFTDEQIVKIEGISFLSLDSILDDKLMENRKEDAKIIKKIEYILGSLDNYYFEKKIRSKGVQFIAGVDEVGRGPLVGPVVAACVVLPSFFQLEGLTDSKKLSEKKREEFYLKIKEQALGIGVGIIGEDVIDEVNIYEATKLAMQEAINNCNCRIDHVLIDAMKLKLDIPTTSIIKGDFLSVTISAASVIAKVTRDHMLDELDLKYPMYDFKNNKGYPTKKHLEAINKYGIIKEHRKSYGPVKEYLERSKSI